MKKKITVAIAGNPNSGKTSIFNMLTGARQHVANYPGVTVEKKEGFGKYKDYEITFVDLPGTYSLTAYSVEELVARNFIIDTRPDVVVDIVDSSNIERNLYLATQLIEMNAPLVLAFNMSDIAEQRGLTFDIEQLSELFGTAIVQTVGNKAKGKEQLLKAIIKTAEQGSKGRVHKIHYGIEIEDELAKIEEAVKESEKELTARYPARWVAVKLLEQDSDITSKIKDNSVIAAAGTSIEHLKNIFRDDPEIVIADRRYGFISGACQETIKSTVELRHNTSDVVDSIVTNRILGLPIFLLLMFLTFFITFKLGKYPMEALELFFSRLSITVAGFFQEGSQSWLKSLDL